MALMTKEGGKVVTAAEAPKIEFPCDDYVIKIVSLDLEGSHAEIVECMIAHAPEMDSRAVSINRSSKGRFVSYSFRIVATSEEQLSALNQGLMSIDAVKMVM